MIVIVMGVVGAGKTTIGQLLAQQLGWVFADADDFHPASNVEKISRGKALTDEDRDPWLASLRDAILDWTRQDKNVVLACSALKQSYRARLQPVPSVFFVYLKGSAPLIAERLRTRHGHFAGESILASQLHDLEEPIGATTVDINDSPEAIVAQIRKLLCLG